MVVPSHTAAKSRCFRDYRSPRSESNRTHLLTSEVHDHRAAWAIEGAESPRSESNRTRLDTNEVHGHRAAWAGAPRRNSAAMLLRDLLGNAPRKPACRAGAPSSAQAQFGGTRATRALMHRRQDAEESNLILRIWNPLGHHGLHPVALRTRIELVSPLRQRGCDSSRITKQQSRARREPNAKASAWEAARPIRGARE